MLMFLIIILLILFFLRVYFYERGQGQEKTDIFISIFRHMYSIKFFFPINKQKNDDVKTINYKKTANVILYCFYILFAAAILYIIIDIVKFTG